MPYRGHVQNGIIVLDECVILEGGTTVVVEGTGTKAVRPANSITPSRYERYRDLIGVLNDLPEDWSDEHDKYLGDSHGL